MFSSTRLVMLVGFLALLLPGVAGTVWARAVSQSRLNSAIDVGWLAPEAEQAAISHDRGRHLVNHVLDCRGCHGNNLAGKKILDRPMVGRFFAPNLTPGRGGRDPDYGVREWDLALRHGVDPAGRPLVYMPAHRFQELRDADLLSIIAYIRDDVEPVDLEMLRHDVGPMFRLAVASGAFQLDAHRIDHDRMPAQYVPGPTRAYGEVLARLAGCVDCHGPDMQGIAPAPGAPAAPPVDVGTYGRAQLKNALRGRGADGHELDPYMPWSSYQGMTEVEIDALFKWMKSL
ncbi:MAG: c-type cytochrome [Myxococcota bacterium]